MKKLNKSLFIAALGILIIFLGFIYDLFYAGIPYQDPTPKMQANFDFHKGVAAIFYCVGIAVFLTGILVRILAWVKSKRKKTQP